MGQSAADGQALAAKWSRLHHGLPPSPIVLRWLRLMWTLARPLARLGVPPMALTALGAVLAVDAVLLAERAPLAAFGLVVASAVCDGLDGAVALVAGRVSRLGARADAVTDRVADTAFAAVIWRCGAPLWLASAAAGVSLGHELLRQVRGGPLLATITVAERPTRVVCACIACLSAPAGAWAPAVCAAVWVAAGVAGLGQLLGATSRSPN